VAPLPDGGDRRRGPAPRAGVPRCTGHRRPRRPAREPAGDHGPAPREGRPAPLPAVAARCLIPDSTPIPLRSAPIPSSDLTISTVPRPEADMNRKPPQNRTVDRDKLKAQLIAFGKKKGQITTDELAGLLPPDLVDP